MVRKKYNLIIGTKTGESLKKRLGNATGGDGSAMKVFGRDLVSGLPMEREITSDTVYEAIHEALYTIVSDVKVILERTPPELAADIIDTGIFITGGSAAMKNFDELLQHETELKINRPENPSECVVCGISRILSTPSYAGLTYVPREKMI